MRLREIGWLAVNGPAAELPYRAPELHGPADAVSAPEGHRPRGTWCGGNDHPVAGDLLDPPGRCPEQEGLPRAGLVDHLLVELAHAPAVGQVDPVHPAVGDRPRVRDGELPRALPRPNRVRDPVPHDPRPQLGELLRRVPAVEHVEHVVEQLPGELRERVGAADELVQLRHRQLLLLRDRHRHDLLGEDVERIPGHDRRLDLPFPHALHDDRGLEQVRAELREDPPLRDLADAVAGAADSLKPARDGLRRLDLEDQVHRAHIDPKLEGGCGHEAGELPGLEQLLDHEPFLPRKRAVVRTGNLDVRVLGRPGAICLLAAGGGVLLRRELVEAHGEPLRAAAVVHEDDRRAVSPNQPEELRVDRGPDRAAGGGVARLGLHLRLGVGLAHVLDGDLDPHVERLAQAGVHDRAVAAATREEPPDLLERALGGRQPDPLDRAPRLALQPLQGERQVRAALRLRHGVDLVDDRPLDAVEQLPGPGGEHQVERLRRGDQDIRRLAKHRLALPLRGVARPDRDRDVAADPLQRRAEVALDVV